MGLISSAVRAVTGVATNFVEKGALAAASFGAASGAVAVDAATVSAKAAAEFSKGTGQAAACMMDLGEATMTGMVGDATALAVGGTMDNLKKAAGKGGLDQPSQGGGGFGPQHAMSMTSLPPAPTNNS